MVTGARPNIQMQRTCQMSVNDRPSGEYVGEGYRIASLSPDEAPSVVLSPSFISELAPLLHAASARALSLTPGQDIQAIRKLCAELTTLMQHHEQASREWLAAHPASGDAQSIRAQLDEVRRMLDEWR